MSRQRYTRKCTAYMAIMAFVYNAGQRCAMMRDKRTCLQRGGRLKRFRLVVMADETPMKLVTKGWDWQLLTAVDSATLDGDAEHSSDDEAGITDADATKLLNSLWSIDLIMHVGGKTVMNSHPTSMISD